MGSYAKKKVEFLVVDTSAFINKATIQEIGENILTVPQVIDEVKSKRQLRRLVVLPYDLSVKEAFPENIKFVNEFSKKTGDYANLSATDINVIALTYQLEKEKNGVSHLRVAPVCKPLVKPGSTIPDDLTKIVGFYVPKKKSSPKTQSSKSEDEVSEYDSAEDEQYNSAEDKESDDASEEKDTALIKVELEKKCLNSIELSLSQLKSSCEEKSKSESVEKWVVAGKNDAAVQDDGDDEDAEDNDDDDHWITPNNIEKAKNLHTCDLSADFENVNVACLTTDFAMQALNRKSALFEEDLYSEMPCKEQPYRKNVLKQIGLNVISLDGKLIKQLRTFILRCYGCFKTTSNMTKVFCPNCGNKTLKKVGVSLNADGTQHLHINFKKPLTARGKRYSLPHFKGGKHSNNPIICEDQPMPQQRPSRLSRTKNNPLNDDYIAGYSPFVTRDVTSKSAMLGIKPHLEMKHWMRKNPNESRKKKK